MNLFLKASALLAANALCACAGVKGEQHRFASDIAFDPVAKCERIVYSLTEDSRTLDCADVLDVWQ
jgi:hypothetical protein